jgi:hypothetical protein
MTSNNSFSVLTIKEPGVEEKSEGAVSPSDSKQRGKKPRKPEWEKAEWRRLPLGSAHRVATRARAQEWKVQEVITKWTHPARRQEVDDKMVEEIRTAYFPDTLGILDNLKEPPQYIRATGNSMMVPMTLKGLNNLKGYTVVGLLDSGATNRFMSQRFVDKHGIEVEP